MTTMELLLRRARLPRRRHVSPVMLPRLGRRDLPALARDLGFTHGAEIGVWKGAYAERFCQASPSLHMLCVDPWVSYPAWRDTKNEMPPEDADQIMGEAYRIACERLAPLNCTIVRQFSAEASTTVADGSLDLVYVDGNHVYDAVMEDLTLWAPKVRPGGLVAGHDFRVFTNKPTIHVVAAVKAYTKAHKIDPWFVLSAERTPSFLWVAR